jgi:hypothetical protein
MCTFIIRLLAEEMPENLTSFARRIGLYSGHCRQVTNIMKRDPSYTMN